FPYTTLFRSRWAGVHLVQRPAGAGVGLSAGRTGAVPPRPASGPQHRGTGTGLRPDRLRTVGSPQARGWPDRPTGTAGADAAVAWALRSEERRVGRECGA